MGLYRGKYKQNKRTTKKISEVSLINNFINNLKLTFKEI